MAIAMQGRRTDPVVGAEVVTMDGHKVGRIQETQGSYFRVRKGLFGHGFWLDDEFLYESDERDGVLMLALLPAHIDDHKIPEETVFDRGTLDPKADSLLSEDEQREQRERMERQLLGRN